MVECKKCGKEVEEVNEVGLCLPCAEESLKEEAPAEQPSEASTEQEENSSNGEKREGE